MPLFHSHPHSPSRAERAFAKACQALSSGWHVFFGVEYQHENRAGEIDRTGEIDALLYHRNLGFLVMEVKGGGVRRHGDQWSSMGRMGWHPIKDPLTQVRDASWFLVHQFKELAREFPGQGFPFVAWGLCFPDVERPHDEWLGHDLLPFQILSHAELPKLEHHLRDLLRRSQTQVHHAPLSEAFEEAILQRFHPCFTLLPSARETLRDENQSLLEATIHQQQLLLSTRSIRRLVIEGCAGSGKSLLASDRARQLARDGESVLLLCLDAGLAQRWRDEASFPGVEIETFGSMVQRCLHLAGVHEPIMESDLACVLTRLQGHHDAQGNLLLPRYDAIVIDEGQDFPYEWWPLIEGFLKRPGTDSLTIFMDPRQNLHQQAFAPPAGLPIFHLSVSVRNTRSIVYWMARETGYALMADPLCPLGEPPVERVVSSPEAQNQALFADLRELLASGIEPDRILLISTSSLKGSSLQTWPQDLPIARATAPGVWPPEHIHFDTVHQVKGLEADVVFLIDIHTNTAPECVYTGASRARHRLYVYKDHLGALEAPEL